MHHEIKRQHSCPRCDWLPGAIMITSLCQRPNCFSFQMIVCPKAPLLFAQLNNKPCNNIVKYTSCGYQRLLPMIQLSKVVRGSKSTFYIQFSWPEQSGSLRAGHSKQRILYWLHSCWFVMQCLKYRKGMGVILLTK